MTDTQTTTPLWTIQDTAQHLNMTIGSTRHWLSKHHIHATQKTPGNRALYNPERVRAAGTDQLRKTEARTDMHHWVRWP